MMDKITTIVIALTCVVAEGSPEGDKRRIKKHCSHLDQDSVAAITKSFQGTGKLAEVLKDARARYPEEYDKCITTLLKQERGSRKRADQEKKSDARRAFLASLTADEKEFIALTKVVKRTTSISYSRDWTKATRNYEELTKYPTIDDEPQTAQVGYLECGAEIQIVSSKRDFALVTILRPSSDDNPRYFQRTTSSTDVWIRGKCVKDFTDGQELSAGEIVFRVHPAERLGKFGTFFVLEQAEVDMQKIRSLLPKHPSTMRNGCY